MKSNQHYCFQQALVFDDVMQNVTSLAGIYNSEALFHCCKFEVFICLFIVSYTLKSL
jgi:hypothetical protein